MGAQADAVSEERAPEETKPVKASDMSWKPTPTLSAEQEEAIRIKVDEEEAARQKEHNRTSYRTLLEGLKLGELKKRARAADSIDKTAIKNVDDSESPKKAIIEILMAAAESAWDKEEKVYIEVAKATRLQARLDEVRHEAEEELAEFVQAAEQKANKATIEKEAKCRTELSLMTLSEIKKKARSHGVSADTVASVDDADEPKAAAIEVTVAALRQFWTAEASSTVDEAKHAHIKENAVEAVAQCIAEKAATIRAETAQMKLGELKARARSKGISEADISAVDDAEAPKEAIVQLLAAKACESKSSEQPPGYAVLSTLLNPK